MAPCDFISCKNNNLPIHKIIIGHLISLFFWLGWRGGARLNKSVMHIFAPKLFSEVRTIFLVRILRSSSKSMSLSALRL